MAQFFSVLAVAFFCLLNLTNAQAQDRTYSEIVSNLQHGGAFRCNGVAWLCDKDSLVTCVDAVVSNRLDADIMKSVADCRQAGRAIYKNEIEPQEFHMDPVQCKAAAFFHDFQCYFAGDIEVGQGQYGNFDRDAAAKLSKEKRKAREKGKHLDREKVQKELAKTEEYAIGQFIRDQAAKRGYMGPQWRGEYEEACKNGTSCPRPQITPVKPPATGGDVVWSQAPPPTTGNMCKGGAACDSGCNQKFEFIVTGARGEKVGCYASMECNDHKGRNVHFWAHSSDLPSGDALRYLAKNEKCDGDPRPDTRSRQDIINDAKNHPYSYDEPSITVYPAGDATCQGFAWWDGDPKNRRGGSDTQEDWCNKYDSCYSAVKGTLKTCKTTSTAQQCLDAYNAVYNQHEPGKTFKTSQDATADFAKADVSKRASDVIAAIDSFESIVNSKHQDNKLPPGYDSYFNAYFNTCYFTRVLECNELPDNRGVAKSTCAPKPAKPCSTGMKLTDLKRVLSAFVNPGDSVTLGKRTVDDFNSLKAMVANSVNLHHTVTVVKGIDDTDQAVATASGDFYRSLERLVADPQTGKPSALETISKYVGPSPAKNTVTIAFKNTKGSPSDGIATLDSHNYLDHTVGADADSQRSRDFDQLVRLTQQGAKFCCNYFEQYCVASTPPSDGGAVSSGNDDKHDTPAHGATGKDKKKTKVTK